MKINSSKIFRRTGLILLIVTAALFLLNNALAAVETSTDNKATQQKLLELTQKRQEADQVLRDNQASCSDSGSADASSQCMTGAQQRYDAAMAEINKEYEQLNLSDTSGGINWGKIFGGIFKLGDNAFGILAKPIFLTATGFLYLGVAVMSQLVHMAASLFDMSLVISISNFKLISDSSGVIYTWQIIRNLLNVSFIFILLYISISIILGNLGPKKKSTIASVIIAAVFINFSLFFTKIVIDLGNYVAISLAGNINQVGAAGGLSPVGIISAMFMKSIGGASITNLLNLSFIGQAGIVTILVIQEVFLGILIWAFLSASILMIGRMVALIILMALSPIGFVGDAIPWLKEKSDEWRTNLINQVVVAPVFIFFILLTFKIVEAQPLIESVLNSTMSGTVWGENFSLGGILNYALAIALLITGIKTTKKLSGQVGEWISKIGKAILAGIAIAVTGGIAIAGASGATISAAAQAGRLTTGMRATRAARAVFTGNLDNEFGVTGMIGRPLRSSVINTVKDLTNKKVDLGKLQSDYKKMAEDEKTRIMKQVNEIGPNKAEEKKKQLNDIIENIDLQAKAKMVDKDEHKTLTADKEKATKEVEANTKSLATLGKEISALEERLKTNPNDSAATSELAAKKNEKSTQETVLAQAETNKKTAEEALNKHEEDFLKKAREDIAKDMGIALDAKGEAMGTLKTMIDSTEADIIKGREAQNKFAAQIEGGSWIGTGLTSSDRTKVANQIRALKGKYKGKEGDALKALRKAFEEAVGKEDDKSGEDGKGAESKDKDKK